MTKRKLFLQVMFFSVIISLMIFLIVLLVNNNPISKKQLSKEQAKELAKLTKINYSSNTKINQTLNDESENNSLNKSSKNNLLEKGAVGLNNSEPKTIVENKAPVKSESINLPTKCELLNGTETYCSPLQTCENHRCLLKPQKKKIGVLYIYDKTSPETFNPDWNKTLPEELQKAHSALLKLTNNKINYTFKILGAYGTKKVCWNPVKLGIFYIQKITTMDPVTLKVLSETNNEVEKVLPGSGFGDTMVQIPKEELFTIKTGNFDPLKRIYIKQLYLEVNDCPHCKLYKNVDLTKEYQKYFPKDHYEKVIFDDVNVSCENNLKKIKFNMTFLNGIKKDASNELGFNLSDYSEVMLIFGNTGPLLASDSIKNKHYFCKTMIGFIGAYSNLIFTENLLRSNGEFIDCDDYKGSLNVWFEQIGWHDIVHEFLHQLGAVDVYNTGVVFGVDSKMKTAEKIDPRVNESIMGNDEKPCEVISKRDRKNECTLKELEEVYLDKYNKKIIGII